MKPLEDYVTTIPNFPKEGIMFRDVTTILNDKDGFKLAIDGLINGLKDVDFDLVLGSESRGFIFGAPVAYAMNKGFVLVRKKGKLPRATFSEDYDLEYGKATLEMHQDAIKPGQKVVIIDDLIGRYHRGHRQTRQEGRRRDRQDRLRDGTRRPEGQREAEGLRCLHADQIPRYLKNKHIRGPEAPVILIPS